MTTSRQLAINRLRAAGPDAAAVDAFLDAHPAPIVEERRCTFLHRGDADEVHVVQRIVGLPEKLPLRRIHGTDLWFLVLELPERSRINYQIEVRRGEHYERGNDTLNPHLSYSPMGSSSVCFAQGYLTPDETVFDPDARPGELVELTIPSRALRRDARVTVYLPARFRRSTSYPLLVVHDGGDFLQYAAAKTVLDNLIHRLDVADVVVAFSYPGDRLVEYANSAAHARFVTSELLGALEDRLPLLAQRSGRCLLGSSFGAVASLTTAYRSPETYGALALMSGSFVFTDIPSDHGGGPAFDPVVKFVNRYRERPRRVADRLFVSCGVYEPLIVPNRSMVPTFESTGMSVRFVETRDGHNWENWRDTLRDALSWIYPGPQKLIYE
ncbi:alpha/beta hydrolase-fold protein [Pseudonocardia sp. GCM10023141]|uniref:alpha/beta hydrolase-fold protein n=1 Tax=Pseudonocardia sp. GCM10023141 TaxID=3252653 RepID=UPI00361A10FC